MSWMETFRQGAWISSNIDWTISNCGNSWCHLKQFFLNFRRVFWNLIFLLLKNITEIQQKTSFSDELLSFSLIHVKINFIPLPKKLPLCKVPSHCYKNDFTDYWAKHTPFLTSACIANCLESYLPNVHYISQGQSMTFSF